MRRNNVRWILTQTFLLALLSGQAVSQSMEIDFIEFVGRNVVVHYNLDDGANSSRQFLVQLYSSQDNFTTALTRVTGDFGTEVSAGFDKKIVWDVTKELGAFRGDIALELRGRVYVPFVKIKDIDEGQVFKHGRNYPLNWTSGNLSGQVNIELFNSAGERMWGENNVANVGKFDWYLPGNIKKGSDYRLKFTNTKDRNDVVFSQPFVIKPKIPLLLKVGAAAVLFGAGGVLINKKSAESAAKPYPAPLAPPN
jgi:hypothetical protein